MWCLCPCTCEGQLFVGSSTRHKEERALVRCNDGRDERVKAGVTVVAVNIIMVRDVFVFYFSFFLRYGRMCGF